MNFILRQGEVWGELGMIYPLVDFPLQNVEEARFCGIDPLILKPTWRNKQVDNGGIYKILDRFLIEENILDNVGKPYLG
jgi:hypothetical protein